MNADQLRKYVVRPALVSIRMWSRDAEALVMGTAAQESHLEYIKQLGNGPALGLFQMEPATHDDIWNHYLAHRPSIEELVMLSIETEIEPIAERMIWDLRYAAIMCRLHYRRVKAELPDHMDIWAQAAYYKKWYNTSLGKATEEDYVRNYRLVQ